MLNWLLGVFIKFALDWLYSTIKKEAQRISDQIELDRKRDLRNEENERRYRDAKSREERIKNALDLINRNN
jgi:hypothetical protein